MKQVIALIAFGLGCNYTIACTCGMTRKVSLEALIAQDLVFKGKAIGLDTLYGEYNGRKYPEQIMATFVVDMWISDHDISDTVTVHSDGGCSLSISLGEVWLLYVEEDDGILTTSICTPSVKMNGKRDEEFAKKWKYLMKMKSTTGYVSEKDEWYHGPYTISGNLRNGKPMGKWYRIRDRDTLAVFSFNEQGKLQGSQMENNEDYNETFKVRYENAPNSVHKSEDWSGKTYLHHYELKDGLRHGKFEIYWEKELHLKATYKHGHLHGEYVTWHEDTAIATGKIRTVKQFSNGKLVSSIRFDELGKVIER
jgi:antitoxin component YwqK of YwqJK toxin-antitoxin module